MGFLTPFLGDLPLHPRTSLGWKPQASAALHSKPGCSQKHLTDEQMSAKWSHGKIPSVHAKDCYVLAEDQWMNQGLTLDLEVKLSYLFIFLDVFFWGGHIFWRQTSRWLFLGSEQERTLYNSLSSKLIQPPFEARNTPESDGMRFFFRCHKGKSLNRKASFKIQVQRLPSITQSVLWKPHSNDILLLNYPPGN